MGSIASAGGPVAAGITAAVMVTKKYIETLDEELKVHKVNHRAGVYKVGEIKRLDHKR